MEFCFTKVYGAVKPMMMVLSTFFISLEYYVDLQCITISFQCYNLLATSMFITRKKFCKAKFHLSKKRQNENISRINYFKYIIFYLT